MHLLPPLHPHCEHQVWACIFGKREEGTSDLDAAAAKAASLGLQGDLCQHLCNTGCVLKSGSSCPAAWGARLQPPWWLPAGSWSRL